MFYYMLFYYIISYFIICYFIILYINNIYNIYIIYGPHTCLFFLSNISSDGPWCGYSCLHNWVILRDQCVDKRSSMEDRT